MDIVIELAIHGVSCEMLYRDNLVLVRETLEYV